jgi:hypothetical protein
MEEALKRTFAIGIAALALGGFAASASAAPWGSSDPQQVCHATGSASNPYVLINPSARGAANGHARHASDAQLGPSVGTRAATPHYAGSCSAGDGGSGGDGGVL